MRTIIHDLKEKEIKKLNFFKDDIIISALDCKFHCIGCFSCWIKTPSKCIMKDDFYNNAKNLKNSDELIIISKNRYGCYSSHVKQILERCIGYVLPYFTIRNNEVHHQSRYEHQLKLTAYFYGNSTQNEKNSINQLIKANAVNLNAFEHKVIYVNNIKELEACIH